MRPLRLFVLLVTFVSWAALPATAHGPTPKKVIETIEIEAPPADVWAIAKNFENIADWHPLVTKSVGNSGNVVGEKREVTLKSGGVLLDKLDEYSDEDMSIDYLLAKENVEAFPVSFYSVTLRVKPGQGSGSEVEWIGRVYRADTSNAPPEGKDNAAAIAAMKEFVDEGLKGLKAKAEAK